MAKPIWAPGQQAYKGNGAMEGAEGFLVYYSGQQIAHKNDPLGMSAI